MAPKPLAPHRHRHLPVLLHLLRHQRSQPTGRYGGQPRARLRSDDFAKGPPKAHISNASSCQIGDFLRDPAPKKWLSTFWLLVQISESTTSVKHVVLNNQTPTNTRKTKGSCLNQRETKRVAKGTSNLSSLRARHIRHLLAEFPGRCQNQRVRCLAPRGFWAHAFGNRIGQSFCWFDRESGNGPQTIHYGFL